MKVRTVFFGNGAHPDSNTFGAAICAVEPNEFIIYSSVLWMGGGDGKVAYLVDINNGYLRINFCFGHIESDVSYQVYVVLGQVG